MPKNAKGVVTCINHPEEIMIKGALAIPQVDASDLKDLKRVPDDLVVTAYCCKKCEYLEFYRGTFKSIDAK